MKARLSGDLFKLFYKTEREPIFRSALRFYGFEIAVRALPPAEGHMAVYAYFLAFSE